MNLPNKLTMLRMLLIPVFLVFMVFPTAIPGAYLWALLVFAVASLTDMLDGQIARKRGLVTNFGKFMDPLADKLLTMAAMVCLTQTEIVWIPAWVLAVILAREFAVTALRTLAADNGVVIAADKWGKIKTICQMVWLCYSLLLLGSMQLTDTGSLTVYFGLMLYWAGLVVVVVATVGSGVNYLWKNRQLFLSSK